jgi:hypothetical protein
MTRLDVIKMIGDVITDIDVARGSLLPDDPSRHQLDDLRILLDDRQRKLSQAAFDDTTQQFQDSAKKLQAVNDQIKGSIQQLDKIVSVLSNIKTFLDAVTSLMTTIGPFV